MVFFVWFDDSSQKQTTHKIDDAVSAYVARFTTRPNHLLVNTADMLARTDLIVRVARTVQPNTFWLSYEEEVAQV